MARLGTPPLDTLNCTMWPTSLTASPPFDHALHARLEHDLVALVEHAVPVGHDAAVRLLRFSLVDHLDLDPDRVALEHGRHDAQLAAEPRHARAMDQSCLHDEPLGERERERARCGPPREDGLPLDVLHVDEERLDEAAQIDEAHDVRLGHGARERAMDGAHLVGVVVETLRSHGGHSPRYAARPAPVSL